MVKKPIVLTRLIINSSSPRKELKAKRVAKRPVFKKPAMEGKRFFESKSLGKRKIKRGIEGAYKNKRRRKNDFKAPMGASSGPVLTLAQREARIRSGKIVVFDSSESEDVTELGSGTTAAKTSLPAIQTDLVAFEVTESGLIELEKSENPEIGPARREKS